MTQAQAWELVRAERARQDEKWGTEPQPGLQMLAILTEEVGEVAQALLERTNLREEIIHVAAVAVKWLERGVGL